MALALRLESSERPVPVSHFPSKHSDCEGTDCRHHFFLSTPSSLELVGISFCTSDIQAEHSGSDRITLTSSFPSCRFRAGLTCRCTYLTSPRTAPTTALHIWIGISSKPRSRAFVQLIFRFPPTHNHPLRFSEANCEAVEALRGTSSSTTHALHFRTAPHRAPTSPFIPPLRHSSVSSRRRLCCSTSPTYPRQRRRLAFFDRLPAFGIDRSPFASINSFPISPCRHEDRLWLVLLLNPGLTGICS